MKSLLALQYDMVLGSRNVLLQYCSTISNEHFCQSNPNFGKGGSMRNLMVHTCNTYAGWLSEWVGAPFNDREYAECADLSSCEKYYEEINQLVRTFIEKYASDYLQVLTVPSPEREMHLTPLQLLTHVMTHEFHHKGQILSISRSFGYTPVDTDIIRQ